MNKVSNEIIYKVKEYLGYDGIGFFVMCIDEYKTISPVFITEGLPHSVHFNEGMNVRNFLRGLEETKDWKDHDFDGRWQNIVLSAVLVCLYDNVKGEIEKVEEK